MKSAAPEVIIILVYLLRCVVPSKEKKNTLTQIHSFNIIQFFE